MYVMWESVLPLYNLLVPSGSNPEHIIFIIYLLDQQMSAMYLTL